MEIIGVSYCEIEHTTVTVYADSDVDFGVETEKGLEETIEVDIQNIDQAGNDSIFSDTDIMTPMNVYDLNGRFIYFNAPLVPLSAEEQNEAILNSNRRKPDKKNW